MFENKTIKLCFYNPHAVGNTLGMTLLSTMAQIFGTNKKKLKKHNLRHNFLLDFLRNGKYNAAIVVDGAGTSLTPLLNKIFFIRNNYLVHKIISSAEIYIWCFLNGINPFQKEIIFRLKKLDEKSDILFTFAFCTDIFLNEKLLEKSIIKDFRGKKILHGTHFYGLTGAIAQNVKKMGVQYMVAEANLKKSSYFNHYFSFIEYVYCLPHVLRKKYKKIRDFQDRQNKCLALGTLVLDNVANEVNRDHYNFFKIDTLHPMRKAIYENRNQLADSVECNINFHNKKRIEISKKSTFYKKYDIFKMFYDLFFLSEGKEYHEMDIVEKYNQFKMFVSPEENIGLSSINFIEGMACGSAYIGLNHPMYTDLGMVEGKHFITYDGTLEDLKRKIGYYQCHQEELSEIARSGCGFAKERFFEEKIKSDFWKYLENLSKSV